MSYTPINWQDRILSNDDYEITKNPDGTVKIVPAGEVIQEGTKMNAENFNRMERGIKTLEETKVEKEDGKGLSTNDFTDEYKAKLDNPPETAKALSIIDMDSGAEYSIQIKLIGGKPVLEYEEV